MNDYELYQYLEESGFEPDEENLEILKENLDAIEELNDFELYQCLEDAGFETSEENLEILKENVVLDEGLIKAIRKHRNRKRAKKRMLQMWKDGKAGPQVKKQVEEPVPEEKKEENE